LSALLVFGEHLSRRADLGNDALAAEDNTLTAIRFAFCTARQKALGGRMRQHDASLVGLGAPRFDTRTMPINGTYGGQGKAPVVTPSAALLSVPPNTTTE
jgi:hypothetical protein